MAALPAIEALRADYTEIWVARQNVSLIRFADCVRAIADTGLDLVGIPDCEPPARIFERLAGFDDVVSWYGANRPEFRQAVAGLPFRFLTALPPCGVHAADFYLAQVGGQGPAVPHIPCRGGDGGFAVIHPFSGSRKKNWPLERFRELARALEQCIPVRWCAGPEDALDGAVRLDDLYELACWLAQARLFIGNDSGIAHLAAAVGTPVVALFGPSDPAVWAPRGPHVIIVQSPEPGGPMESLTAEQVLSSVRLFAGALEGSSRRAE